MIKVIWNDPRGMALGLDEVRWLIEKFRLRGSKAIVGYDDKLNKILITTSYGTIETDAAGGNPRRADGVPARPIAGCNETGHKLPASGGGRA